jgi:hypothetical protein
MRYKALLHLILRKTPWALLSLLIQLFVVWAAYYLYINDYGYSSGRSFSYFLSFSYFVLGAAGLLGMCCSLVGMSYSILTERWYKVLFKLLFYVPALFLSVVWCYLWLVLLAWI